MPSLVPTATRSRLLVPGALLAGTTAAVLVAVGLAGPAQAASVPPITAAGTTSVVLGGPVLAALVKNLDDTGCGPLSFSAKNGATVTPAYNAKGALKQLKFQFKVTSYSVREPSQAERIDHAGAAEIENICGESLQLSALRLTNFASGGAEGLAFDLTAKVRQDGTNLNREVFGTFDLSGAVTSSVVKNAKVKKTISKMDLYLSSAGSSLLNVIANGTVSSAGTKAGNGGTTFTYDAKAEALALAAAAALPTPSVTTTTPDPTPTVITLTPTASETASETPSSTDSPSDSPSSTDTPTPTETSLG